MLTFDEHGLMISAEISESMSHDHSVGMPLLGFPIRSSSSLVFIRETEVGVARKQPDNLVSDSIEIKSITSRIPLSQVEHTIATTLSVCVDSEEDSCLQSLTSLLQRLSPEDTETYLREFFSSEPSLNNFTKKALILINTLSQLESSRETPGVSSILTEYVLQSTSMDTPLVVSALRLLTRGRLLPDR